MLRRFSATVDKMYAAALEPSRWPDAVSSIAALHASPKANLLTPTTSPAEGGFIFSVGFSPADIELWGQKYFAHDIWARRVMERGLAREGNVILGSELVTDQELENSLFYREFLKRQDAWHLCTGIVFDGQRPRMPITAMSLFKPRADRGFRHADLELYRLTVNHLSRALGTMYMLRDAELRIAATLAALDRSPGAVVLFGRRGNVVFANRRAHEILKPEDGLFLRAEGGAPASDWLRAASEGDTARINAAVKSCIASAAHEASHFGAAITIARSARRPLILQVSPLPANNEFSRDGGEACAIGFITDPENTSVLDHELLKSSFQLTVAECVLAQELLESRPLGSIAARLGLSENTVKTQLQSVFEKTGTHRQAELVKLLVTISSTRN
ncbi:MAG TPA: helix-turn-helix transcriptional regulator [Usitatibacter sp.]|nr:helix-turn-helix transcriptional regulator [Usitatibacter sp.]